MFIHDDVWIDDIFFVERITEGLRLFDAFGVIGNRRCAPMQPSWAFPDRSLTWDQPEHLMGAIAHGDFPFGKVQKYEQTQGTCALFDGVMIVAQRSKLEQHQIRFDERFEFHFYDVDFCRSMTAAGLNLGIYPISLTHQSTGCFGDEAWGKQYVEYVRKWCPEGRQAVKVTTTPAHDHYNPDLLALMTANEGRVVEVGCSRGALARAYLGRSKCEAYIGIEIDAESAEIARQHCTRVMVADIEAMGASDWDTLFPSSLWIFGDALEHLRDPWSLLKRLRASLDADARVIACIPNMQHWSMQATLATGELFYQEQGLLDRTHLRWFTRKTSIDLFESSGYAVQTISPRILEQSGPDAMCAAIGKLARLSGGDARSAVNDCLPFQYVLVARPL